MRFRSSPVVGPGIRRASRRLRLELLEDRTLLSVLTVTDTSDSSSDTGSLRYALMNAQDGDTVDFDIPTSDPGYNATTSSWTIEPSSPLPAITNSILIDGFSQRGYSGTPVIELNGSQAGTADGLTIRGSGVTVRGLDVNGFTQGFGILISGSGATGNWIYGSYLGTDPTGELAYPNGDGVEIDDGASANLIGTNGDGVNDSSERNVISGNTYAGVSIGGAGTEQNIVAGNYIGTDATGESALGNGSYFGVQLTNGASVNWIGVNAVNGPENADQGNVISGNDHGVEIDGSDGNTVAGNDIGTDCTGTEAIPNNVGVRIEGGASGNLIGTNGDGIDNALERNILSGNRQAGVWIFGTGSDDNVVAGNFIGASVTGDTALGNGSEVVFYPLGPVYGYGIGGGVVISAGASHNLVGTSGQSTMMRANATSSRAIHLMTASTSSAAARAATWLRVISSVRTRQVRPRSEMLVTESF